VVDYRIPGQDGLAGLSALHERLPYMALIMATGQGDEVISTEAMKRGALDYIPKALLTPTALSRAIANAVEKTGLRRKIAQQREELENFARVLAHDLRSPISSVRGFATVIEEQIQQGKPDNNTALYCQMMVRGVDRMGALIAALHEYTSAEKPVELENLNMSEVLSDTVKNLDHVIRERGARVTHGDLPPVYGNGPLLIQLLQNLIANSIKYCEETPSIHISATPSNGEERWLFSVQDNGIGIPKNNCQDVFAPFKRLHGEGKYEGTGLGLAICRKIAERHESTIWCESTMGRGTRFSFFLDRAHATAKNGARH
jgi:light-regulated signal transduction histidine kinase (bacteriophytochrome)